MDPNGERLKAGETMPLLSDEELEHRIGASDAPATRVRRSPAARPSTERGRYTGSTRRRILWRDSATILIGVILALLGARFLIPSGPSAATGSPTPADTGLIAAASPTLGAETAGPTPSDTPIPTGVVVPSGLHLDATPTPIPVITLPPATPRPSPTPTLKPGETPAPTLKPGTTPTPVPKPTPTQGPPVVSVTCTVALASFDASCTSAGSANVAGVTIYTWDFGDGSAPIGGGTTKQHTYTAPGAYVVTLTITNSTGSDTDQANVTIPGL